MNFKDSVRAAGLGLFLIVPSLVSSYFNDTFGDAKARYDAVKSARKSYSFVLHGAGKVPKKLYSLTHLDSVIIRKTSNFELSDDFSRLKSVKYLNLSNNWIKELPVVVCNLLSLEELDLSNNELSSLPEPFLNLENLKRLDLSNNYFKGKPAVLENIKDLEVIL